MTTQTISFRDAVQFSDYALKDGDRYECQCAFHTPNRDDEPILLRSGPHGEAIIEANCCRPELIVGELLKRQRAGYKPKLHPEYQAMGMGYQIPPVFTGNGAGPVDEPPVEDKPPEPRLFKKFLTFKQALDQPPPSFLVEELLFSQSLFEIFGPPNQGKTFVMMSLAFSIRMAGPWFGRAVPTPGPVVYVNADGGMGFYDRMRAYDYLHPDEEPPFEFYTYPESISLHRPQEMHEFRAALAYFPVRPAAVVFDTYSRCIPGVNENQQDQASLVVQQLDRIREEIGACVGLLHHTDKTGVRDRGSSVILGACDTQIRVDKQGEDKIAMTCEKQRDSRFFDPLHFQLDRIPGTNWVWLLQTAAPAPAARAEDKLKQATFYVISNPGCTREELAEGIEVSETSAKRYAAKLVDLGVLVEVEGVAGAGPGPRPKYLYPAPGKKRDEEE